jgi:hypothetical protein
MTGAIIPPEVYVSARADSGFGGGMLVMVDSACFGSVNNERNTGLSTATGSNRNGGGPVTFKYGLLLPDQPRAPNNPMAIARMIALAVRALKNLLIQ